MCFVHVPVRGLSATYTRIGPMNCCWAYGKFRTVCRHPQERLQAPSKLVIDGRMVCAAGSMASQPLHSLRSERAHHVRNHHLGAQRRSVALFMRNASLRCSQC